MQASSGPMWRPRERALGKLSDKEREVLRQIETSALRKLHRLGAGNGLRALLGVD